MNIYAAIDRVDQLLIRHQWMLNRCRRQSHESIHYFVTDVSNSVLTPKTTQRRVGLSLIELLLWLEGCDDQALSETAHSIKNQLVAAVVIGFP